MIDALLLSCQLEGVVLQLGPNPAHGLDLRSAGAGGIENAGFVGQPLGGQDAGGGQDMGVVIALIPLAVRGVDRNICRHTVALNQLLREGPRDVDPRGVMDGCADRPEGTWITPEMHDAYLELFALGWVRSVELWDDGVLVGGLYGVQVGGVFTGESMFSRRGDASKVALLELCHRFAEAGGVLVDVQLPTDHLRSLGAVTIARADLLRILAREGGRDVRMRADERPVSRLSAG